MNLVKTQTLHQHLRDDEALVVENAIRLAIDSIINVLCGVNSARSREQQRMVADRDREIRRLEARLSDIEHELKVLRRQGCSCRLFAEEEDAVVGPPVSGDPQTGEQGGFEAAYTAAELEAEQQECEISVGLFARPSSHVSSQSLESAVPSPPSGPGPGPGLDQSCTSRSSESSEAAIVIKEEPCDVDAILIKWEMSEERSREIQESTSSPSQDTASPTLQRNLCNVDGRTLGEKPQEDSGRLCDVQELHLRNKKKGVPMSELTEEAQKLKRAAWRAASRRYYARKVARQQANPPRPGPFPSRPGAFPSRPGPFPSRPGPFPSRPGPFPSRPGPFPHITDSTHYPQPGSLVDRRRRSLISELPEDSQSLQREAWRAASRRYYARKTSRPVTTDPAQYEHLLHSIEPSGETLGPNGGGIMCS